MAKYKHNYPGPEEREAQSLRSTPDQDGTVPDALTKEHGNSTATKSPAPNNTGFGGHQQSDAVKQAQALLQQLYQKPGAYQSAWQAQLDDTIQKILNREEFSYDLNGDALYQQYKGQQMLQGQQAMMDAMGQAQAMTGGYGNSYAQTVGQQAYQGHIQQLNDKIPELYQLALSKYQMEGDELKDRAAVLAQMEDRDYGRWADDRDFGYGQFIDDRNYQYQQGRDEVADKQWQAEFDEAVRQYNHKNGIVTDAGGDGTSVGSAVGIVGGTRGYDNGDYDPDTVRNAQAFVGASQDGKWGSGSAAAAEAMGYSSLADVVNAMSGGGPGTGGGFTGSTYSEAAAYLKSKGISAAGLMTQSEWQRHKNSNNSANGEHEAGSYAEYLIAYMISKGV